MRAPPAPSTTTAAVCTPSVPLCPTSSFVRVRAVPRGHRPCAEEPRATAGAPAPPPVRHSVQEVQMLSKDCPPKIRSRLAPQTLQFPEVKTRFSATLSVLGQQMLTTCVWFRMTCLDSLTYVVTVWCIVIPLNVLKCDRILFFLGWVTSKSGVRLALALKEVLCIKPIFKCSYAVIKRLEWNTGSFTLFALLKGENWQKDLILVITAATSLPGEATREKWSGVA